MEVLLKRSLNPFRDTKNRVLHLHHSWSGSTKPLTEYDAVVIGGGKYRKPILLSIITCR